jgi:hypothetical protein
MADLADQLRAALADRYVLERELGRGGMAMVYLAQNLDAPRQAWCVASNRCGLVRGAEVSGGLILFFSEGGHVGAKIF